MGQTCLHLHGKDSDTSFVEFLMRQGADDDLQDKFFSNTALDIAIRNNRACIVSYLSRDFAFVKVLCAAQLRKQASNIHIRILPVSIIRRIVESMVLDKPRNTL